jgi:hypothetical protein
MYPRRDNVIIWPVEIVGKGSPKINLFVPSVD